MSEDAVWASMTSADEIVTSMSAGASETHGARRAAGPSDGIDTGDAGDVRDPDEDALENSSDDDDLDDDDLDDDDDDDDDLDEFEDDELDDDDDEDDEADEIDFTEDRYGRIPGEEDADA
jgi:hypothetical protein